MSEHGGVQPTIGQNYKTGELAELIFEDWVRTHGLPRKQEPDFFVDYLVEIIEADEPTGRQLAVQVKGIKVKKNCATPLKYAAKVKHVRYWLYKCQRPVFVFLINTESRSGYWLFAQTFAKEQFSKVALEKQTKVTLKFCAEDCLANKERFLSTLQEAERYVRNLHPGSVQAALEKERHELEEKEPRLSYQITATEDQQTVHMSAKEPFDFRVLLHKDRADGMRTALKRAMEQGSALTLSLDQIKFSGSPLFEELNEKAQGELVVQFGKEVPGSIVFQSGQNLHIEGLYRTGTKTATFRGGLPEAPFEVQCIISLPIESTKLPLTVSLDHSLKRWHGKPVLQLPYLDQIFDALAKLVNGGNGQIELYVRGNRLARASIGGPAKKPARELFEVVEWIRRCRVVAERYGVNPCLPDLDKVTNEQWENVNDLFGLLTADSVPVPYPGLSMEFTLSGSPENHVQPPAFGCIRLDNQNALVLFLGKLIPIGALRLIFTNITMETASIRPDGQRVVRVRGNDSTLRVLERS